MNVLTTTWRQLVRRKLWPVAVLLVAALAAVPVLLAKDPDPVAPVADPVPASAAKAGDEIAEPVVAMAEAGDRDRRRRVLGGRKDPFEPAPPPKANKKAGEDDDAVKPGDDGATGGRTAPSDPVGPGLGTPPSGGSPVIPTPVEPKPKPKVYPPDSLIVRFGDAESGSLVRSVLRKLEALPSADEPLVVYLGLTKDDRKAIFLVDESLEPTGDGACKPHPSTCEKIHLRKGETEFFDLIDPESGEVAAQYQLDLVDIKSRDAKAKQSKAAKSAQVAAGI